MKCEGCLFDLAYDTCQPVKRGLIESTGRCHLTPDNQRFIDAMIRGVFYCGHCVEYEYCHEHGHDSGFCMAWQERKEGEDG